MQHFQNIHRVSTTKSLEDCLEWVLRNFFKIQLTILTDQ